MWYDNEQRIAVSFSRRMWLITYYFFKYFNSSRLQRRLIAIIIVGSFIIIISNRLWGKHKSACIIKLDTIYEKIHGNLYTTISNIVGLICGRYVNT